VAAAASHRRAGRLATPEAGAVGPVLTAPATFCFTTGDGPPPSSASRKAPSRGTATASGPCGYYTSRSKPARRCRRRRRPARIVAVPASALRLGGRLLSPSGGPGRCERPLGRPWPTSPPSPGGAPTACDCDEAGQQSSQSSCPVPRRSAGSLPAGAVRRLDWLSGPWVGRREGYRVGLGSNATARQPNTTRAPARPFFNGLLFLSLRAGAGPTPGSAGGLSRRPSP